MLSNDKGVDIPAVHTEMLAQEILKPTGIQDGPRSNHPIFWKARQTDGCIGQDVHRIRYDEEDSPHCRLAISGMMDLKIATFFRTRSRRVSGFLGGTGGHHDDGRIDDIIIIPGVNIHGAGEG